MSQESISIAITIVGYDAKYVEAFERLNMAWLERYELLEAADRKYLEHPEEFIIAKGGEIFFALQNESVVGTCAAIPRGDGNVELAKLAVDAQSRGHGVGTMLTESAIAWARARKARSVVLVSSTKLKAALRLYERLGFRYGAMPANPDYETADIYMDMQL